MTRSPTYGAGYSSSILSALMPPEVVNGVVEFPPVTDELLFVLRQIYPDMCPDYKADASAFDIAMHVAEQRGIRKVIARIQAARTHQLNQNSE